jgi:hypothetical protein
VGWKFLGTLKTIGEQKRLRWNAKAARSTSNEEAGELFKKGLRVVEYLFQANKRSQPERLAPVMFGVPSRI